MMLMSSTMAESNATTDFLPQITSIYANTIFL